MTRIATAFRSAQHLSMILVLASVSLGAYAQQQAPVPPMRQSSVNGDNPGFGNGSPNPHDPEQARMMKEMSRDRNALRQKEIVADTDQLMDLVKQLKDAVDRSNKDQLSLSVVNTATEIEKLAKSVKEKMRDGQ